MLYLDKNKDRTKSLFVGLSCSFSQMQFQFVKIAYFAMTNPVYNRRRDDVSAILTENECYRLKEVIFTNEKIRTILKQNQTKEKMMMLKDYRQIREIIHPKKWMVLTKTIYSSR